MAGSLGIEPSFGLLEALEVIDQGLLWLDEQLCVKGHNTAYRRLVEIEDEPRFIGKPYQELLQFLHSRGEYFGADLEALFSAPLASLHKREPWRLERVRPNGVALSISAAPLPSGGYICSCIDVTQEMRAREAERRNTKATIVAMANFAEHRDSDTGVHVLRVSRLTGQTARKLLGRGKFVSIIDEGFIEQVAAASILHDVGKISTPDRILLKNGPLTADERDIINQHTLVGSKLLKQAKVTMGESPYLDMGIDIALSHHEWFNGTGYPFGLRGDDIPLAGRICAVADVFDALTSRRPYKTPWSAEEAVKLIRLQSGNQFDPDIAEALLEVIAERETVSLVRWSDAMSVGDVHIDEQHTILIDTINQLASAESRRNHHAIAMIIDELASYAAFHFEYEENLIAAHNYPHLEEHRRIHQGFVQWVSDFREEYATYGKRPVGERVLNFLRDWLSSHILGEDQRYRPFIRGNA